MNKSLSACAIAIGLLFAGLDSASSANAPLEKLTVNVFPGGFNWPLFVARDKGFFARKASKSRCSQRRDRWHKCRALHPASSILP